MKPDRPTSRQRADLGVWYEFVLGQAHHLSIEPDVIWQQGANMPAGHPVADQAADCQRTGRWPARPWFQWINKPAPGESILLTTIEGQVVARSLLVDPTGRHVIVHNLNGHVLVFDSETGREVTVPVEWRGEITWIGSLPGSGHLAWAAPDGSIACGEPMGASPSHRIRSSGPRVRSGIGTAAGRLIIQHRDCPQPEVWIRQGNVWESRLLPLESVGFMTASPAAPCFAMVQRDGIAVVDEMRGESIAFLEEAPRGGEANWQCPIALSSDGGRFFAGVAGGGIAVWDVVTRTKLRVLAGHPLHHAMDGKRLEADRRSAEAGGHSYQIAHAQHGGVVALAADPRGRFLASASNQGLISLWDFETGEERLSIAAHDGNIYNICFFPDGSRLVSAGFRSIKIWKMPEP